MTVLIPPPYSLRCMAKRKRKDGMKDRGEENERRERGREGRVHSDHPRTTL